MCVGVLKYHIITERFEGSKAVNIILYCYNVRCYRRTIDTIQRAHSDIVAGICVCECASFCARYGTGNNRIAWTWTSLYSVHYHSTIFEKFQSGPSFPLYLCMRVSIFHILYINLKSKYHFCQTLCKWSVCVANVLGKKLWLKYSLISIHLLQSIWLSSSWWC